MHLLYDYLIELWNLTAEMAPYLLLGLLFAGLLRVFFPQDKLQRWMGQRSMGSVLRAALLGIPLPLCSCGVIPTGVSFYRNGASRGATLSFLISTPQTGVDSVLATYAMLGGPFAVLRPVAALVTGLVGGWLGNVSDRSSDMPVPATTTSPAPLGNRWLFMLRYAFVDFLQDIQKWLVIGLLVAAAIATAVPDQFFAQTIGQGLGGMLLMLAVSVPMYVCATASVPIAAVLLAKGMAPGAVLVFLMAGPATNAATIAVLSQVLGRRTFWIYLLTVVGGALFFGMLIDYVLPASWFVGTFGPQQHVHVHGSWWATGSAVLLAGLLGNGFYLRYFAKKPSTMQTTNRTTEIVVEGMECKHCKANVETNLSKIAGIDRVEANFVNGSVLIEGTADLEQVQQTIESLGYTYKGPVLRF